MKNLWLSMGLATILLGCASEPTEEIQQAETAMSEAKQAAASEWAPEAFQKAEEKMAEANRLVAEGEYAEAVPVLDEAVKLAAAATRQAAQAKQNAQAEKERAAEAARQKAEAEEVARRSVHTVIKGECLWYIAGSADLYGDPYQWPRIYDANRDKIRDPDLIYPNQVLRIPR